MGLAALPKRRRRRRKGGRASARATATGRREAGDADSSSPPAVAQAACTWWSCCALFCRDSRPESSRIARLEKEWIRPQFRKRGLVFPLVLFTVCGEVELYFFSILFVFFGLFTLGCRKVEALEYLAFVFPSSSSTLLLWFSDS